MRVPHNLAGFFTSDERSGKGQFFVLPEVFAKEAVEGYDPTAVLKELERRGHLDAESGRLQRKVPGLPDGSRPRAYAIFGSFLEGE